MLKLGENYLVSMLEYVLQVGEGKSFAKLAELLKSLEQALLSYYEKS